MTSRTARVGALLAAAVLMSLSVVGWSSPVQAAGHTVTMQGYSYGPAALTIEQGDTVTWVNRDEAPHDVVVTSGPQSFRSPLLDKGESWSFTFGTAGTYSYTCSVHPDMRAGVTVQAAPEPPPPAAEPPAEEHTHAATEPAPAASAAAPGSPAPKKTRSPRKAAAIPTAATTPVTNAQVGPAAADTTLNPLLLVAGVAVAVVVFCLLMLASRPAAQPATGPDADHQP